MIFVLSGEGPTDLGACSNAQGHCSDGDFDLGPMTVVLDQTLAPWLGYSLRDFSDRLHYVSEAALCAKAKSLSNRLRPARSKKMGVETGYFFANAMALGVVAKELEVATADQAIAVLFRDCDGSRSDLPVLWSAKHASMMSGFTYSQFDRGVPMLPKPTSEAWLLCVAQETPYWNCAQLEALPGNQASPNHPKKKLDAAFGGHKSREELCEWLDDKPFDPDRAGSMPSFQAFRDRLHEVVHAVLH